MALCHHVTLPHHVHPRLPGLSHQPTVAEGLQYQKLSLSWLEVWGAYLSVEFLNDAQQQHAYRLHRESGKDVHRDGDFCKLGNSN